MLVFISRFDLYLFFNRLFHSDHSRNEISFHSARIEELCKQNILMTKQNFTSGLV